MMIHPPHSVFSPSGRHMRALALTALALLAPCSLLARLVIYPEYPDRIERDYAYAVRVVQGGEARAIPVYNHCEKSALADRTRGGDVNRRFCEFAFSGDPVRVDIAVCEDVQSYTVFPASRHLKHRFRDGVISVLVEKPTTFGIRLNDADKTILSVFADAPEDPRKLPRKGDPGVLYVDGWTDATNEEGTIEVEDPVREVYIAPGAVLNARLRVKTKGAYVHGRGMVLDPFSDVFRYDQTKNTKRFVLIVSGDDAVVEDVKLVDARTFNFGCWATHVTFRNVRALSSMMCSDGITVGGANFRVEGAWLYVGDNALVVSGTRDSVYRDIAIGTSCTAIFPQSSNANVTMERVDVFRADGGLVQNTYNASLQRNTKWDELEGSAAKRQPGPQDRRHQSQSFLFRDFCAMDSTHSPIFFKGGNMGTLPKTFVFENLSIPYCTGSTDWRHVAHTNGVMIRIYDDPKKWLVTDNYTLAITNLWIGGRRAAGFAPKAVVRSEGQLDLCVADNGGGSVPTMPDRHVVDWTCPYKVYVGPALRRDWRLVDRAAGERRLPAPPADEDLLADRGSIRSDWQRSPSWLVKFEATRTDENGARIYRLVQCEKDAGIQNVFTDRFLPHGAGIYRLRLEVAAELGGEGEKPSPAAIPLRADVRSNETQYLERFEIPADGAWHTVERDVALDFDPAVTELVALQLRSLVPVDELRFRNISLRRVLVGR